MDWMMHTKIEKLISKILSGMPIQAAADNLRRDIITMFKTMYDEEAMSEDKSEANEAEDEAVVDLTKFKAAKTKAASKKGKGNQWQTLEAMGIPRDIIPRFVDPIFWLQYFPPLAKEDLIAMGVKVDWRRSVSACTQDTHAYACAYLHECTHAVDIKFHSEVGRHFAVGTKIIEFSPVRHASSLLDLISGRIRIPTWRNCDCRFPSSSLSVNHNGNEQIFLGFNCCQAETESTASPFLFL